MQRSQRRHRRTPTQHRKHSASPSTGQYSKQLSTLSSFAGVSSSRPNTHSSSSSTHASRGISVNTRNTRISPTVASRRVAGWDRLKHQDPLLTTSISRQSKYTLSRTDHFHQQSTTAVSSNPLALSQLPPQTFNTTSSTRIITPSHIRFRQFTTAASDNTSQTDDAPIDPQVIHGNPVVGEDGELQVPFTKHDALLIRLNIMETIHKSPEVAAQLQVIGDSNLNAMKKWSTIEGIVGTLTLHVMKTLHEKKMVTLPDIGTGALAVQNYETLYKSVMVTDETDDLKSALTEQWSLIMELAFKTDPLLTRNARISPEAARRVAKQYYELTESDDFREEIAAAVYQYPMPDGTNPLMYRLQYEERENAVTEILAPKLIKIYSQFQYTGDEGYCLMSKALQEHFTDPEVVDLLSKASQNIARLTSLDSIEMLEQDTVM